eukprot:182259-Pelagomonas_calceolata.AAC.1
MACQLVVHDAPSKTALYRHDQAGTAWDGNFIHASDGECRQEMVGVHEARAQLIKVRQKLVQTQPLLVNHLLQARQRALEGCHICCWHVGI